MNKEEYIISKKGEYSNSLIQLGNKILKKQNSIELGFSYRKISEEEKNIIFEFFPLHTIRYNYISSRGKIFLLPYGEVHEEYYITEKDLESLKRHREIMKEKFFVKEENTSQPQYSIKKEILKKLLIFFISFAIGFLLGLLYL